MAWGTPTLGTVTKSNSDSTPTLSLPSHATGDLLVAVCSTRPNTDVLISSIDQGYIELVTKVYTGGTNGELTIFAKVAGASEVAPTVTLSGTPQNFVAFMFKVTGGPASATVASDLIDNSQTSSYADSNQSSYIPTITPSVDNDLIVWASVRGQIDWNASGATVPPGSTLLTTVDADLNYAGSVASCLVIAYEIQTTKTTRAEWSNYFTDGTAPADVQYCAVGVALKAGAATTKYLRLTAHSTAASESSIEGVVLNAARDTVIGEFTGQAFEAALDGGLAELLIATSDISPNGSTLTTSDTPLAVAYNATYTTGLVSCTVIEV